MLSCTEFIPAYSELFKFIEKEEGHDGVVRYWEQVSDQYVSLRLGECIRSEGLRGCYTYWSGSLNEEAADFTMTLNESEGWFKIVMHDCPSKRLLLNLKHLDPYYDYCGHCDLLYRRVVEREGFNYSYDFSGCDDARCAIYVSGPPEAPEKAQTLVTDRRASDNKYLHRDFHALMDVGIAYIGEHYGDMGVDKYLRTFASAYYAPLIEAIRLQGLAPLQAHIETIYAAEEASQALQIVQNGDELSVKVGWCPAVAHMKSKGQTPSKWYMETTRTICSAIADAAGICFKMLSYNDKDGAAEYKFWK